MTKCKISSTVSELWNLLPPLGLFSIFTTFIYFYCTIGTVMSSKLPGFFSKPWLLLPS